jgi:hypothetical protein
MRAPGEHAPGQTALPVADHVSLKAKQNSPCLG